MNTNSSFGSLSTSVSQRTNVSRARFKIKYCLPRRSRFTRSIKISRRLRQWKLSLLPGHLNQPNNIRRFLRGRRAFVEPPKIDYKLSEKRGRRVYRSCVQSESSIWAERDGESWKAHNSVAYTIYVKLTYLRQSPAAVPVFRLGTTERAVHAGSGRSPVRA